MFLSILLAEAAGCGKKPEELRVASSTLPAECFPLALVENQLQRYMGISSTACEPCQEHREGRYTKDRRKLNRTGGDLSASSANKQKGEALLASPTAEQMGAEQRNWAAAEKEWGCQAQCSSKGRQESHDRIAPSPGA